MEEAVAHLRRWMNAKTSIPDTVQIYPTNRCNLNCRFCCQKLGEYDISQDLSREKLIELAQDLCAMGVKNILISGGGEPLLSPATIDMMVLFKKSNVKGRMIHNGTAWTDDSIKRVVASGWDALIFSLDGMEKTHDALRGQSGAFRMIIGNIRKMQAEKEKSHAEFPAIETNTVLTVENYREIADFVKLASGLGIRNINIEPVCVNNPEVEKLKLSRVEREEFLGKVLPAADRIAKERGVSTNFHRLFDVKIIEKTGNLREEIIHRSEDTGRSVMHYSPGVERFLNSPCYEPWLWPKIEANGEVWPCSTSPLRENIKEKSFRDIWYGKAFTAFRENILNKKLSESCSNCVLTHLEANNRLRQELRDSLR